MDIVKLIKAKCIEKDLSLKDLERALGFSNGYIQTLKKPMKNYDRAKALSEYLDIPIEALLYGRDPEEEKTAPVSDIIAAVKDQHGDGASEAVRMLLELNDEGRAELRGEMRQMLRLRKYNDELSGAEEK